MNRNQRSQGQKRQTSGTPVFAIACAVAFWAVAFSVPACGGDGAGNDDDAVNDNDDATSDDNDVAGDDDDITGDDDDVTGDDDDATNDDDDDDATNDDDGSENVCEGLSYELGTLPYPDTLPRCAAFVEREPWFVGLDGFNAAIPDGPPGEVVEVSARVVKSDESFRIATRDEDPVRTLVTLTPSANAPSILLSDAEEVIVAMRLADGDAGYGEFAVFTMSGEIVYYASNKRAGSSILPGLTLTGATAISGTSSYDCIYDEAGGPTGTWCSSAGVSATYALDDGETLVLAPPSAESTSASGTYKAQMTSSFVGFAASDSADAGAVQSFYIEIVRLQP